MSLTRIGFTADEVFPCVGWRSGQLGARAEIHQEEAVLRVRTGLRLDVWLQGYYVHRRGLPIVSGADDDGLCQLTEFRALGRSRRFETAKFTGGPQPGKASTFAGELGMEYMDDAILGLDAAGPAIGLSTRADIRAWKESPTSVVSLVPDTGGRLPVTTALRDRHAPEATPAFMLCSGQSYSFVTRSYIEKHWLDRKLRKRAERALLKGETVGVTFELPGQVVELDLRVMEKPLEYSVDLGVEELHGSLGNDFLRRWMQVFDFPGRQLLLFDYSASRGTSNRST